jgi:hypothetical protein
LIAITSKQWITASLIFLFENPSFFSVFHAVVLCITSVYRGKFICQPEGKILGEQIGESPLFTFHGCTKHETMPRRFGNLKPLYTQKSRHQVWTHYCEIISHRIMKGQNTMRILTNLLYSIVADSKGTQARSFSHENEKSKVKRPPR